ncbi:hypothetical protein ABZ934_32115 [Streptomyces sp. NPDC046557]|uniref:hypothetical protein n=1 Tax=Streptomyces sp. NPDC046557 TaxID=3155372 RepID=UPI0034108DFD
MKRRENPPGEGVEEVITSRPVTSGYSLANLRADFAPLASTAGVGVGVGGELEQQTAADLRGVAAADPVRPQAFGAQVGGEGGGVVKGGGESAGVGDTVVVRDRPRALTTTSPEFVVME